MGVTVAGIGCTGRGWQAPPHLPPGAVDVSCMIDVVMVQCWLFGLELCTGGSVQELCKVLDAMWPASYRPHATA